MLTSAYYYVCFQDTSAKLPFSLFWRVFVWVCVWCSSQEHTFPFKETGKRQQSKRERVGQNFFFGKRSEGQGQKTWIKVGNVMDFISQVWHAARHDWEIKEDMRSRWTEPVFYDVKEDYKVLSGLTSIIWVALNPGITYCMSKYNPTKTTPVLLTTIMWKVCIFQVVLQKEKHQK